MSRNTLDMHARFADTSPANNVHDNLRFQVPPPACPPPTLFALRGAGAALGIVHGGFMSDANNNNTPTPAPSFTPEWKVVDEGHEVAVYHTAGRLATVTVHSRDDAESLAARLNATASLYAYAKALALIDAIDDAPDGDALAAARKSYQSHVRSMGWDGKTLAFTFLRTYRAAALAQAEGRNP